MCIRLPRQIAPILEVPTKCAQQFYAVLTTEPNRGFTHSTKFRKGDDASPRVCFSDHPIRRKEEAQRNAHRGHPVLQFHNAGEDIVEEFCRIMDLQEVYVRVPWTHKSASRSSRSSWRGRPPNENGYLRSRSFFWRPACTCAI